MNSRAFTIEDSPRDADASGPAESVAARYHRPEANTTAPMTLPTNWRGRPRATQANAIRKQKPANA